VKASINFRAAKVALYFDISKLELRDLSGFCENKYGCRHMWIGLRYGSGDDAASAHRHTKMPERISLR